MRGARHPAKEAAVVMCRAMLLSFPNKHGVGMSSCGTLFELFWIVWGTIFLWAGSKNVVHLILLVWIFAREMSPPQRIIWYPVPGRWATSHRSFHVPPLLAEEFAANHGWLLFHDKVKTTQVYLHDTTLVGDRLVWHNATTSRSISSIFRVAAVWRQIGYDWLE